MPNEKQNRQQNNSAGAAPQDTSLNSLENEIHAPVQPETEDPLYSARQQTEEEEQSKPGFMQRFAQRLEAREQAVRAHRVSEEGKAAPDRAFLMMAAIPFWAVAATTLKNGIVLCLLLIVTLIPASYLRFILRQKLSMPNWLTLPIAVMVSMMLASGGCAALTFFSPALYDSLGMYLFLLAAAPVLMNSECYGAPESSGQFWKRTFRFILDFCIIMLISSIIRELLGYNTIFGMPVNMGTFKMDAAGQPFFGLIFAGALAAALRSLQALFGKIVHYRKTAEKKAEEAGT